MLANRAELRRTDFNNPFRVQNTVPLIIYTCNIFQNYYLKSIITYALKGFKETKELTLNMAAGFSR